VEEPITQSLDKIDPTSERQPSVWSVLMRSKALWLLSSLFLFTTVQSFAAEAPRRLVVPVVGSTAGAQGANFRTGLQLHNPSAGVSRGHLVYRIAGQPGTASDPRLAWELAPFATRSWDDIVAAMGQSGLGSLDIVVDTGALPVVTARAFDDGETSGTKGVSVPALRESAAIGSGQRITLIAPADPVRARFNLGVRTRAAGARVAIALHAENGDLIASLGERSWPADYFLQQAAADFLGRAIGGNQSVAITVLDGSLHAYATMTDNLTNDPSIQLPLGSDNVVPQAAEQSLTTGIGQPLTIRLTGTDPDDDFLLFSIQGAPTGGSLGPLSRIDGKTVELLFTPPAGFEGSLHFDFAVEDANGGSSSARITIEIGAAENHPPVTSGQEVTTDEDTALEIVLDASDPDGDQLTFTIIIQPQFGTVLAPVRLSATSAAVVYSPEADFHGVDSFRYRVSDGRGGEAEATVTILVLPVNDPPVAVDDSYQMLEDQVLTVPAPGVLANDIDVDGDLLTAHLLSGPANGTLTLASDGGFTYMPNADYFGIDTFSYRASDGLLQSAPATVTITVAAVNDPPSFTIGAGPTVLEDAGAQSFANFATNISPGPANESSQIVQFLVTGNTNQALFAVQPSIAADGTLTFTGAPDANGAATITVVAQDDGGTANGGVDTSAPQSFTITITAVNDAPSFTKGADQVTVEDAGAQTVPNWATAISAGPADEAGQSLTFLVSADNPALFAAQPAISADGTLTYTPQPGTSGVATITVRLQDDGGTANGGIDTSAPQTFTITINQAPQITSGNATTFTIGQPGSFTVTTIGRPAATLTLTGTLPSGVTFTDHGDGTATLGGTPAAGSGGTYVLTITAANGVGANAVQSFTLTVNQPPAITSGNTTTFTIGEAGSFTVTTDGFPAPALSATGALPAGVTFTDNGNGTATLSGTPASGTAGSYPLTITASNGVGVDATQNFTLVVEMTATTLTAQDASVTFGGNVTLSATLVRSSDSSPVAGRTIDFSVDGTTVGSGVTGASGIATFDYAPANAAGTYAIVASFTSDGTWLGSTGNATLTMQRAASTLTAAAATVTSGDPVTLGATLTRSSDSAPIENRTIDFSVNGTLVGSSVTNASGVATFDYTPANEAGSYTILAEFVQDGFYLASSDTDTLTIDKAASTLAATDQTITYGDDVTLSATLTRTAGGAAISGRTISFSVDGTVVGSGTTNGSGVATFTYTPTLAGGSYAIVATFAEDGFYLGSTDAKTLTVNKAATALVAADRTIEFGAEVTLSATLTSGGDPLSGKSVSFAVDGTTLGSGTTDASGVASFTYTPSNGAGSYPIVATFSEDSFHLGSTDTATLQIDLQQTTLVAADVTAAFGEQSTLTATLTRTTGGAAIAGQTITFQVDGAPAGSATTNASGIATVDYTPALTAGGYPIAASFAGTVDLGSSNDTATLTVNRAATTLVAQNVTIDFGDAATLTATLTRTSNSAPLEGETISFTVNGVAAGTATTNASGVATLSHTPADPAGSYAIVASFAQTGFYLASTDTKSLTINKAATTLVAADAYVEPGNPVTLSATLTRTAGSSPIAGRTISFSVDGTGVGSGTTDASGVATFTYTPSLTSGTYPIGASFSEDGFYLGSTDGATLTVAKSPTTLVATSHTISFSDPVTLTATLTNSTTSAPVVGRTVDFTVDGASVGSGTTGAGGVASLTYTPANPAGSYTIVASFTEDGQFLGSSDNTQTLTIDKTATTLIADDKTISAGDPVTLTATLTRSSNDAPIAGQTVSFSVNGAAVGSGTTDASGVASFTYTPANAAAGYTIDASFAENGFYLGATDTATLTISKSATTLVADDKVVSAGSTVTLTATLTRTAGSVPISGKSIAFTVDGAAIATVATDASGLASHTYTPANLAGVYEIVATFVEDAWYLGSTDTAEMTMNPGPLSTFLVEAEGGGAIGPQGTGASFNIQVTAKDANGNTITAFDGAGHTVVISSATGTLSVGGVTTATFTNGVLASHTVAFSTEGNMTITATHVDNGTDIVGTSNVFPVDAAPAVISTTPASNAISVALNATITINFSEEVEATTSSFEIRCPSNVAAHPFTMSASPATSFTLTPTGDLPAATICQVTVFANQISDTDLFDPPDNMDADHVFSFSTVPLAVDDSYGVTGNIAIQVPAASGLLVNDIGTTLVVHSVNGLEANVGAAVTTSQGGTVTVQANGSFAYDPPAGVTGASDTFTYAISGDSGISAPGTVTFNLSDILWFVCDFCGGTNGGTLLNPYTSLASFSANNTGAAAKPADNQKIYILSGTYGGAGNTLTLRSGQQVWGQGVAASAVITPATHTHPNFAALTAGTRPLIAPTSGHGITLPATGNNAISHLNVGDTAAVSAAISGNGTGTVTITNMAIGGTGQTLNLQNKTLAATFDSIVSTSSSTQGMFLQGVAGSLTAGSGSSISGSTGHAVAISTSSVAVTWDGNISKASAGRLVSIDNHSTGGVTFQNGTLQATAGDGIVLTNADGAVSFNGTTTLSGGARVLINGGSSGAISFGTGASVTNPASPALEINNGNAATNVTYAGTISTNSGRPVHVEGVNAGSVTVSGNITATGNGLLVQNNSGGTISFTGTTKSLTTGANAAVTLANNTGATINFSNGGLAIARSTGAGITATGGGTLTITRNAGSANTIGSGTSGAALNVNGLTIGAGGLVFQSIAQNGGANGIVLNNTGATAGLTVTGSGTAGSGGTIQNTSGGDGGVAGNGIHLTGVTAVSLDRMILSGHTNHGIFGTSVNGFSLANSTVQNNGSNAAANGEGGIYLRESTGTATITNVTVNQHGFGNGMHIYNSTVGTLNLTVTGSSFSNSDNDGILVEAHNNPNVTVNISTTNFSANRGDHLQVAPNNASVVNATITGGTFTGGHPLALGQGITMRAGASYSGTFTYDINGITINSAISYAINTGFGSTSASGLVQGKIRNNTIGTGGVAFSGSAQASCILAETNGSGTGTHTVSITGNTLRNCYDRGIEMFGSRDGSNHLRVTVTGNNIGELNGAFSRHAIHLESGSSLDTEAGSICADLENNILHAATAGEGIRVRLRSSPTARFRGYIGLPADLDAFAAYLSSRNSGPTTGVNVTTTVPLLNTDPAGSACPTP
jgi:large repetitive protein